MPLVPAAQEPALDRHAQGSPEECPADHAAEPHIDTAPRPFGTLPEP
ncbi:hypothetical protein ACWELB_04845 [Streptomyces asiaticus]